MSAAVTRLPSERRGLGIKGAARLPARLIVGLVGLLSLLPFIYLISASLRPVDGGPPGILWQRLFEQVPVGTYLLNSIIVAGGSTVLTVVLSAMAGFGFAKLAFPARGTIFGLVVAAISVPVATIILPNYLNLAAANGVGAYWAPILLYTAGSLSFSTILTTSFFSAVPDEVIESAAMDGASYIRTFVGILLPMAKPALVTVGVLAFITAWNDLLIALLLLPDPSMRTISVGVASLQGVRVSNLDIVLTGSLLSVLPPVLAFVLFQKYLVSGITAGISK